MRELAAAKTAYSDSEVGEGPYARPRMAEKEARPAATTQGTAVTSSPRIKTNQYDGRGTWKAFQSAFEAIVLVNQWSEAKKGGQLIAALDGEVQSCILTLPTGERTNYTALAAAVEQQFGQAASSFTHVTRLKERWRRSAMGTRGSWSNHYCCKPGASPQHSSARCLLTSPPAHQHTCLLNNRPGSLARRLLTSPLAHQHACLLNSHPGSPACLPAQQSPWLTSLPACSPAHRLTSLPACSPAHWLTSLPACSPACPTTR
ncbi:UNVERIFIED_CONTAM: hypothetical protein FKN15_065533 [Acipenser sinensis]